MTIDHLRLAVGLVLFVSFWVWMQHGMGMRGWQAHLALACVFFGVTVFVLVIVMALAFALAVL